MGGLEFTRNQKLALVDIIGLIAIAVSIKMIRNASSPIYGGVTLTEPGQSADGVAVAASDSDPMRPPDTSGGKVIFQVAGHVKSPNVYTLPKGSRLVDAIKVAGGLKPGANIESLNLAARIEDGSRIFVPSAQAGPTAVASYTPPQTGSSTASTSATSPPKSSSSAKLHNPGEGIVHINTADLAELQRLPGVGPSTAQAIIDYRTQVGRFSSPEQLDDVKGIGTKKLEKMRPFLAL